MLKQEKIRLIKVEIRRSVLNRGEWTRIRICHQKVLSLWTKIPWNSSRILPNISLEDKWKKIQDSKFLERYRTWWHLIICNNLTPSTHATTQWKCHFHHLNKGFIFIANLKRQRVIKRGSSRISKSQARKFWTKILFPLCMSPKKEKLILSLRPLTMLAPRS